MYLYSVNKSKCSDINKIICNNYSMNTYADRLKQAMKARNIDQSALARLVGVKQQSIQYLCRQGKQSVHSVKIAGILKISASWLTDGTGDMELSTESIFIDRYKKLNAHQKKVFDLMMDQINEKTQEKAEKAEKTLDNQVVKARGGGERCNLRKNPKRPWAVIAGSSAEAISVADNLLPSLML